MEKIKTDTFVLELGCEELPHDGLENAARILLKAVEATFKKIGISYRNAQYYFTAKRLVIHLSEVVKKLAAQEMVKRGPTYEKVPSPALLKACNGFATAAINNLTSLQLGEKKGIKGVDNGELKIESLQERTAADNKTGFYTTTEKNKKFIIFYTVVPSKSTASAVASPLSAAISNLRFDESMFWGNGVGPFLRPVRSILALLGSEVVPLKIFGLQASNVSFAHRFFSSKLTEEGDGVFNEADMGNNHPLANHSISISNANEYFPSLAKASVELASKERATLILQQIQQLEEQEGVTVSDASKAQLVFINASLVENPHVFTADFSSHFLRIPAAVLESEMINHQKYFPTYRNGRLTSTFFVVSNMAITPQIISGNQAVLAARLADGAFLFDIDREMGLLTMANKLTNVMFYEGLGSYSDICYLKYVQPFLMKPLHNLFSHFPDALHGLNSSTIINALAPSNRTKLCEQSEEWFLTCLLMKADLTCEVVKEFPEVQGIMGAHYLRNALDEEKAELWRTLEGFSSRQQSNLDASSVEKPKEVTKEKDVSEKKSSRSNDVFLKTSEAMEFLYKPISSETMHVSVLAEKIAFVDKVTDVVCLFSAGATATGSEDVFGLRRKTAASIEMLILARKTFNLSLHILQVLLLSKTFYGKQLHFLKKSSKTIEQKFLNFEAIAELQQAISLEYRQQSSTMDEEEKMNALLDNVGELMDDEHLAGKFVKCNAVIDSATELQLGNLYRFFNARLKTSLSKRFNSSLVSALVPEPILLTTGNEENFYLATLNPYESYKLLSQLQAFIDNARREVVTGIILAAKRVGNMLNKTSIKSDNEIEGETLFKKMGSTNFRGNDIKMHLLSEEAEQQLHYALQQCIAQRKGLSSTNNNPFASAEKILPSLGNFFDNVMVNVGDIELRRNRYNLLFHAHKVLNYGIDWQKIDLGV